MRSYVVLSVSQKNWTWENHRMRSQLSMVSCEAPLCKGGSIVCGGCIEALQIFALWWPKTPKEPCSMVVHLFTLWCTGLQCSSSAISSTLLYFLPSSHSNSGRRSTRGGLKVDNEEHPQLIFRWWQPLHGVAGHLYSALDFLLCLSIPDRMCLRSMTGHNSWFSARSTFFAESSCRDFSLQTLEFTVASFFCTFWVAL